MKANLFHRCLSFILKPIINPGKDGISMRSGNGIEYNCHPIFAIHVGDYPEQCEVTCVPSGSCPTCFTTKDSLGEWEPDWIHNPPLYDLDEILDIMDNPLHENWPKRCAGVGLRPVFNPYWKDLPYADPFLSITPDILHQLYQGILKHLILWLKKIYGSAEIDARASRLPPNHHVRIFSNGFCSLSKLTGREHADICRVILGIIIDIPIKKQPTRSTSKIIQAVRALLDFAYLARYPVHSGHTLNQMMDALRQFHENKDIFIDLGARVDWKINKLHYAIHYRLMIERYGTADNYNTEYTERLHIPFAKDAYNATNSKDEYPQMTQWIERKEKILDHERYIAWCLAGRPPLISLDDIEIPESPQMTKFPSRRGLSFDTIAMEYHAPHFQHALTHFVLKRRSPHLAFNEIEAQITDTTLPFTTVSVYHRARFWLGSGEVHKLQSNEMNVVYAQPARTDTRNRAIQGRFDTVLVNEGDGEYIGLQGHRVGQVKVIFALTPTAIKSTFPPNSPPPQYLAYVEWFSAFENNPLADHQFYQIEKLFNGNDRLASIVPLSNISRSVHLIPKFDPINYRKWSSANVLDNCDTFYLNHFSDRSAFHTMV